MAAVLLRNGSPSFGYPIGSSGIRLVPVRGELADRKDKQRQIQRSFTAFRMTTVMDFRALRNFGSRVSEGKKRIPCGDDEQESDGERESNMIDTTILNLL
jgi:hypothetical protein